MVLLSLWAVLLRLQGLVNFILKFLRPLKKMHLLDYSFRKLPAVRLTVVCSSVLRQSVLRQSVISFLGSISLSLLPQFAVPFSTAQSASAQTSAVQLAPAPTVASTVVPAIAPTVRYAQGEDINLAEIVAEWRGYYEDVPVYLCTCQESICDQTQQWPYREYDRYQLGVALGPNNGKIAEASGANCFDIADGSRPDNPRQFSAAQRSTASTPAAAAPPDRPSSLPDSVPVAPPSTVPTAPTVAASVPAQSQAAVPSSALPPNANRAIPTAMAINNGSAVQLTWPSGASNVIEMAESGWTVNVLDATNCTGLGQVEQKTMQAQTVVGNPVVDSRTGYVAVPVLLDSCADVDQSAIFVLDANEGGGYSLYRVQLPGDRNFPNEFSTYAFSSLRELRYWEGSLLVRHGSASSAEAVLIFRSGLTPAGEYAGCGVTRPGEGADVLCPQ